jgi:hypothetical protein
LLAGAFALQTQGERAENVHEVTTLSDADPGLLTEQSLREFFRSLLDAAIENQRARGHVQQETELYLVNLLGDFLSSEALYVREDDGSLQRKPLALLLKEALEEQGQARAQLLRRLGDTSLFVSGFFGESLNRSLVGVEYYKTMGERAYDALGQSVARRVQHRTIYAELAEKFGLFVELLSEVSDRTFASSNAGVVRLYERYLRGGSERLANLLKGRGLLPLTGTPGRFLQ